MTFTFRPLDPLEDAELLHRWLTHPKAAFWMMQDARQEDVERAYMEIAADEHQHALLGLLNGEPAFLMEQYDPAHRELVGLYEPEPGDVGMHFLVPATDTPVHGFTRAVITAVVAHLFEDPATERFPFGHARAPCWIRRAGSKWKLFVCTYEVPGGLPSHREQIVQELCAVYRPGCNERAYEQAWKDEWIGGYTAPTTGPLTTGRDPGDHRKP